MIVLTALVFVPALLNGVLLADLLWPARTASALALKLFLGIGIGLGLRSLLYFIYLLVLPAQHAFIYVDLASTAALLGLLLLRNQKSGAASSDNPMPPLTRFDRVAAVIAAIVVVVSLLSTANYLLRRRQGDWDAWMMYNRAARFLHMDQAHWLGSFSVQMDPIFHPDYPLFLAGDIVAGWELLGRESAGVPMLQSALFSIACLGLLASAVAAVRSFGQAMLGIVVLWGLPVFVNEGARQMADVPMAFFILATGTLLFMQALRPQRGLLALAGICAGLGAWTKNEGAVLVVAATAAVVLVLARRSSLRALFPFLAGAAVPVAILLGFRIFIAPSGDILGAAAGGTVQQILDPARHAVILTYLWGQVREFGSWSIPGLALGILPILLLYLVVFYRRPPRELAPALRTGSIILGVQILGYYAAYLVSPYDLAWHLTYSSTRIVLQVLPLLAFLILAATVDVGRVFDGPSAANSES